MGGWPVIRALSNSMSDPCSAILQSRRSVQGREPRAYEQEGVWHRRARGQGHEDWGKGGTHIMVIAMRAVLVALLIVAHIFPKRLFAFLAHERHLRRLAQPMVLCLCVALCAVEPLLAAWRADGDLGVEDVFARKKSLSVDVCATGESFLDRVLHQSSRVRRGCNSPSG